MKAWRKVGRKSAQPQFVWPKYMLMSPLMIALFVRGGIYR
jgi:hypothetical protein